MRKVYYIDPDDNPNEEQKETVALPSSYDEATTSESYLEQLLLEINTPVETADDIYMVETKDSRKVTGEIDDVVLAKAKAAIQYCNAATEYNLANGGNPWKYVLLSSSEVKCNSSLKFLVENGVKI